MSQRAFIVSFVLLAMLVALSATRFAGAMIGFLYAIAGIFFAGVPGAAIDYALNRAGIPVTGKQLLLIGAALYARCSPLPQRSRHGGGSGKATWTRRSAGARLALLMALPLSAWLSLDAMQRAWP
ncbi:hypothetical protein EH240_04975 [Mesorhizobium tamadayense]|uniref:Uncharacterized protein n=1 Tax=Mesorhizobium tamadayense TaxID=425306 RepID=A0A3P3G4W1_9HYPH|nr:hypothetical protein [Mesorhizobium tamadayense]RRI05891.1 hypothetical protein EH240_04975 [Mesorhizobium tamadayense]